VADWLVSSTALVTPGICATTSSVPRAAWRTLWEISEVAADCCCTAPAISCVFVLTSPMVVTIDCMASTAPLVEVWIAAICWRSGRRAFSLRWPPRQNPFPPRPRAPPR
jgi:hypothetical protein